ncbi:hypothetical protein K439DRAFT_1639159, partial [Ramaria rubella]
EIICPFYFSSLLLRLRLGYTILSNKHQCRIGIGKSDAIKQRPLPAPSTTLYQHTGQTPRS